LIDRPRRALFTAERWRELRAWIDRVDGLPATARAAEIDRIAASDAGMAASLRVLLAGADDRGEAGDRVADALDDLMRAGNDLPAEVGPFRPLERIGAGGMGVIYLAERRHADFVQRVALKILDGGPASMAQFAARERRILAALAHPNITAFVDAGSENGRAWLAMEYVDGDPLLAYCERLAIDVAGRVRLLDQVCAAVAHAHAQLVVHRDLKPSNVLVNAGGVVKLLDFGIAVVLDPADEQAPATRVFTPEYAAPEQLRGERVTTATDVHALGLMLYELVSGRRLPTLAHGGEGWTAAGLARHATQENRVHGRAPDSPADEPRTRKVRTDAGFAKLLARHLRGDLGRILAHALATEPRDRYASVALLREDLARWLDHRPLTITRPGFGYVASRFVRRHRVAVAASVLAVAMLIGATGLALWQADRAERFAARAEHGKAFLLKLFAEANPFEASTNHSDVRALLRDAARRIDTEFADAPDTRIEMRDAIADVLTRIGDPLAGPGLYRRNLDQLRHMHGPDAPEVGAALQKLALATEASGDIATARKQFTESYAILRDAGDAWRGVRISVTTGLARMANRDGDHAEAERLHQTVLRERLASEGPQSPDIAMDLMNLGADALYQERYAQAEALAQRAHAMLEHTLGPGHPRSIYVDNVLGLAQAGIAGHVATALATMRADVALARATLPPDTEMLGSVISVLGDIQFLAGDDDAAVRSLTEAQGILKVANSPAIASNEMVLGLAQLDRHVGDALETLRDARARLAAMPAAEPRIQSLVEAAYGAALAGGGAIDEGERIARAARANLRAGVGAGSVRLADIDRLLAGILDRRGAGAEARSLREEGIAIYRRVYGPGHPRERSLAHELAAMGERRAG
jgi:serine/threonine-protein kinase